MVVDIPDKQATALKRIAEALNLSPEALALQAIASFLENHRKNAIDAAFGVCPDAEDGLVYQERLRAEWDR